jgi:hypothetical protein
VPILFAQILLAVACGGGLHLSQMGFHYWYYRLQVLADEQAQIDVQLKRAELAKVLVAQPATSSSSAVRR